MNSSSWAWRTIGISSILATLLLCAGFLYAVKDVIAPEAGNLWASMPSGSLSDAAPTTDAKELNIVSLGDSLAKGTGDDTGQGFVRRAVTGLQQEQKLPVKLVNNLGVNGMTTKGLLPTLSEEGVQYVLRNSNIILLSIGGNDLFQGAQNVQAGKALPTYEELSSEVEEASARLKQIVDRIHKINPTAQLVYVGLYNPFNDLKEMRIPGNQAVAEWNMRASEILNSYETGRVVSTFDIFTGNTKKYLADDHFHPNGDGYQYIAERIVQGLR
ncbi:GDSL-type esterase/lipase family protein [Paenibacillus sp. YPG26]|uniref:GDSL-type esterase/lipase family protein n=1 Tax=Paenibacillus sp. YPG26 TaxID=2878915 RepID=UPI00203F51A8|nr:GDSL-type esterase/lipase family protein [Paenibacillus sp. YPG26]USB34844.1 GDSL-type esterase/lipase family protein [Paenibacillus sp. YPG26]